MSFIEAFNAFLDYQDRRNENPDNQRMSKLRRGPGEDGVERLRSRDEYGSYYVVDCNLDPNGNWQCKHHYHDYPVSHAWHTLFRNGGHYFQHPDGSSSYYHPQRSTAPAWTRSHKYGPKENCTNPRSPCIASVNPPPRWWIEENRIVPFPGQNDLADALDRRFPNAPSTSRQQNHQALANDPYDFEYEHDPSEYDESLDPDEEAAEAENEPEPDDELDNEDEKDGSGDSDDPDKRDRPESAGPASQSPAAAPRSSATISPGPYTAAQSPSSTSHSRTAHRASRRSVTQPVMPVKKIERLPSREEPRREDP